MVDFEDTFVIEGTLHEIDTFLVYNKNIYDYDIRILSFNTKIVDFKTFKQIHFS